MGKLKYVQGKVIIEIDLEGKNSHTFSDGTVIRLERQYNEFNRRITQPVNAKVLSAENINEGAEVLISHNALHDTNRIFSYKPLSGKTEASNVQYFSIPEADCFAWRGEDGVLKPMKNFAFALRVFKPYTGIIAGIDPYVVEKVLYITTGEYAGKVAHVLKASDYEIIFQGQNGREDHVIRLRHFEEEVNEREEVVAISHGMTEMVEKGELLIGLSATNCKQLNEIYA